MENMELPNNGDIEQELLSQILQKNDLMVEALEILDANDFYIHKHQKIYEAMKILFKQNNPIEYLSIAEVIGKEGLKNIGGITYITELYGNAPSLSTFNYNLKRINDYSQRRKSIKMADNFIKACYDTTKDINENITKFNSALVPVEAKNSIEDMSTMLGESLGIIEENYNRGGGIPGMESGLIDFDEFINGFEKPSLDIIAGRPSMGKTTFSLAIAEGLAKKHKVLFFSTEQSKHELMIKLLASKTWLDSKAIKKGDLKPEDFEKLAKASAYLSQLNLKIDDRGNLGLEEMRATIKREIQQGGVDVVIVDYLQRLRYDENNENAELTRIIKGSKTIAKEFDLNFIMLSQLNRGVEQRPDKRPRMSDLRGSGGIEQEGDKIHLLYRDEYYYKDSELKGVLEVITAKNRNGSVGTNYLTFLAKVQSISCMDHQSKQEIINKIK